MAQGVLRALQGKDSWTSAGKYRRSQRVYVREFRASSGKREDPRKASAALAKRRETMLDVKATNDRWLRDHPGNYSAQQFRQEILPRLQGVHLVRIMAATGLTNSMASLVRRGRTVPHPRHWAALSGLGQ